VVTLLGIPAAGQEVTLPPEPGESRPVDLDCLPTLSPAEAEIVQRWIERGRALRAGSVGEADRVLEQALTVMRTHQIRRMPHLAAALLAESEQLRHAQNFGQARVTAHWATSFDPLSATARFQVARTHWRSKSGLLGCLKAWFAGLALTFRGFWRTYVLGANLALVLGLSLALAGAIFSVALLLRHGPSFVHEAVERLPRRWPEGRRKLLGYLFLYLPLALFIGGAWVLLWWPALLFRFANRSERILSVVLLALMTVSGPFLEALDRYLAVAVSPTARVLAASEGAGADDASLEEIERLTRANPQIAPYHFLLANLYAAQIRGPQVTEGDQACFQLAEAEYRKAMQLDQQEARYPINLGNLYFRNGSFRAAWTRYRQALEVEPGSILARYNLATAYGQDITLQPDREEVLREAGARDAKQLQRYMDRGAAKEVVDATLTHAEMSWHILVESMGRDAAEKGIWGGISRSTSLAGMVTLGLLIVLALLMGGRPARRCGRCGQAFCHRCKADREGPHLCPQCLHLFLKRDGLAPAVREQKTREIDRYERRGQLGGLLVRLLLPGADRLGRGRTWSGLVILLVWIAGLLWLMLAPRLLVPADLPLPTLGRPSVPPLIALLCLLWIGSNVPRRRHRSRRKV
jgi:tetratricopeptide (TPR) repeat protein